MGQKGPNMTIQLPSKSPRSGRLVASQGYEASGSCLTVEIRDRVSFVALTC